MVKMRPMWEINAEIVSDVYGGYVDCDERFYNCPECDEPIYECDWSEAELEECICPICGFVEDSEKWIIKEEE